MHYAIELTLDATTTSIVKGIEGQLSALYSSQRLDWSEFRPHVTLGICEELDITRCHAVLLELASELPLACRFDSLGAFMSDPAVVFAAPVVSAELLDLHARFHTRFGAFASEQNAYYLPGRWVPHCTLAERLPIERVPDAIRIASSISLPLVAAFSAFNIFDVRSARILRTLPSRSG